MLRFGSGIFYNRPLLRTIDDFTLGHQQLFFDTNSLRDPLDGKLMTAEQRRAFIAANFVSRKRSVLTRCWCGSLVF